METWLDVQPLRIPRPKLLGSEGKEPRALPPFASGGPAPGAHDGRSTAQSGARSKVDSKLQDVADG